MASCTKCGTFLRSGVKFCGSCGTKVAVPTCVSCGAALRSKYSYACSECGTKVEKEKSSSERPPAGRSSFTSSDLRTKYSSVSAGQSPISSKEMSKDNPDLELFLKPAIRTRVLYVAPKAAQSKLRSLFYKVHKANRGDVLWVEPEQALEKVQKELNRKLGRISCVCIIGSKDDIPHVHWDNPLPHDPDFRGLPNQIKMEMVETDNPYGMIDNPTEEERMTGHLINDIPVTRIPSLEMDLLLRLLSIHQELAPDWLNSASIFAEAWTGPTRYTLDSIGARQDIEEIISPPNEAKDSAVHLAEKRPSRLLFNVHGSDSSPEWFGEDYDNTEMPMVLKSMDIQIAKNAIVCSEACYGALIKNPKQAIAYQFLSKGAGCFLGSTIVAWGAIGASVRRGGNADLMMEFFYQGIDQGLPIGEALRVAKLKTLEAHQDENGVINAAVHNTLASFVVYGAPFASVGKASKSLNLNAYQEILALNREIRKDRISSGSVLDKYRKQLQGKLPAEVWESLSQNMELTQVGQLAIPDAAKELLKGSLCESGVLNRYRSGNRTRQEVFGVDKDKRPKTFLVLDEAGNVLEHYVAR